MNLSTPLDTHVRANHLGVVLTAETGFRLASNPDTVLAPDISFVGKERIPDEGLPEGFWPGPPDLPVEVLSPSQKTSEIDEKVREYLRAGTRAVVIVDPDGRSVTVHWPRVQSQTLVEQDTLELPDVVPGFRIKVAQIFH